MDRLFENIFCYIFNYWGKIVLTKLPLFLLIVCMKDIFQLILRERFRFGRITPSVFWSHTYFNTPNLVISVKFPLFLPNYFCMRQTFPWFHSCLLSYSFKGFLFCLVCCCCCWVFWFDFFLQSWFLTTQVLTHYIQTVYITFVSVNFFLQTLK